MAANDFALLIGIAHYPRISNLKGPLNDVAVISNWLADPAGGNVPTANIHTIVSAPGAPGPDLAAIRTHWQNFMNTQAAAGNPPPHARV